MIGLILQARMSSNRLPGKVMMKMNGKPLLQNVVEQCRLAYKDGPVIVCTSNDDSDDVIFDFCKNNNIDVFRGSLLNVYSRYVDCIKTFGLHAFGRVCCDSPGISPDLIQLALKTYNENDVDLVSNVCVRSFPVGQSIEIVNVDSFVNDRFKKGEGFSEEHVTQMFYKNLKNYKIYNIKNLNPVESESWAVDNPGDFERVSELAKLGFSCDFTSVIVEKWET